MISFFPSPYEDEMFYSMIARYKQWSAISVTAITKELFNSKVFLKSMDFPQCLDCFVSNLPWSSQLNVERVIFSHTMYPFYTSYLTDDKSTLVSKAMAGNRSGNIWFIVGNGNKVKHHNDFLTYCPVCFEEDMKQQGESYWRRMHQVPGAIYCWKHEVRLKLSSVYVNDNGLDYVCADEYTCNQSLKEDEYPADVKEANLVYLKNARKLFQYAIRKDHTFIVAYYVDELRKRGYTSNRGTVRMQKLTDDFLLFYSKTYLQLMQSDFERDDPNTWLRLFMRNNNKNKSPLRHLLFQQFLGLDPLELFRTDHVKGKVEFKGRNQLNLSKRDNQRKLWLKLIEENPGLSRRQLKDLKSGLHSWVYEKDNVWYHKVTPISARRKPSPRLTRVDWEKRDEAMLEEVKKARVRIIERKGKPLKIDGPNLRREVSGRKWFYSEKMIRTNAYVDKVSESTEGFRKRKIYWAIDQMYEKGLPISVSYVQRFAGVTTEDQVAKETIINKLLKINILL